GFGFMFAPLYHPAMRHAVAPRREIGIRTVFNILGPLTNPARAQRQLTGVAVPGLGELVAQALARLGSRRALVVHGEDGLDELSIAGPTTVYEVRDGQVRCYQVAPEDVGLRRADTAAVRGGTVAQNVALARAVLAGEPGPGRDVVVLNASAALYAGELADSLDEGARRAEELLESGTVAQILEHEREEVQARRQVTPPAEVRRLAEAAPPPRGFAASLRQPGMRVIAEVKRVSPAKGALRLDADAPALAQLYEQGGAAAISVLTDQRF